MLKQMGLMTIILLLVALALPLVSPTPVLADDTGWNSPTSDAFYSGTDGFDDASNAYADGGGSASNDDNNDQHLFYDYNLGIPANAAIDGIVVRLDAWLSSVSGTSAMKVALSWDGGTNWTT